MALGAIGNREKTIIVFVRLRTRQFDFRAQRRCDQRNEENENLRTSFEKRFAHEVNRSRLCAPPPDNIKPELRLLRIRGSVLDCAMKPSLTYIVSGTFALLLTFTFTASASRPDGVTDSGQPYYYAYPDEGTADAENTDDSSAMLTMPPDMSMAPTTEYGNDDSYAEPYYGYGPIAGWGAYGGFGTPLNQHNRFNNQFRHSGTFGRHDGQHNFSAHSSAVIPHQNTGTHGTSTGARAMSGAARSGGAVHASGGRGGGHR
jgi:hypothetical protein